MKRNSSNGLFPSLMEELFRPDWAGGSQNFNHKTIPAVNIRETDSAYEVELSAPGKKKDDFNIDVENELLTISAEFKSESNNEENGKYTRKEFSYSSFKRSFTLPETVKEEDIKASYEDGILRITLPKKEEALPKPKRMIDIS
ncbi:MAG TPA: Hsp20/alpha crystallin family protein [Flavobacterium sp.]|nr:Hsp20/alpha crystallin family protein [Flavobacterium sp.]